MMLIFLIQLMCFFDTSSFSINDYSVPLNFFVSYQITMKLLWICHGNPNDHHAVMQCAPDKVPEYSINQVGKS